MVAYNEAIKVKIHVTLVTPCGKTF